jgi:serine/threonine protein kinase
MIGQTISHYKIVEKLGQGGMGVVYKAEDLTLDRFVALKFLAPHLVSDEDSHKRFIREAKAAATLDHPNICTVYEIGEAEGRTFISMAYVEGHSLEQWIAKEPFRLDDALELVLQMGGALAAAHDKGIVHRDIKPANILIAERRSGKDRQPKLVDFGLAQFSNSSKITKLGSTVGTIAYMSPEQTSGKEVDHRTDIWALGVVLYRLVAGELPFKGHYDAAILYSILNEEPEPLATISSGVSHELEGIVNKALAKDPEDRYQHIDDMLADLRGAQRSGQRDARGAGEGSRSEWSRVQKIFLQVCDLEPESRRQRLEELCGDDQPLRQEVERWLRHDTPDGLIDSSPSIPTQAGGGEEAASWNEPSETSDS